MAYQDYSQLSALTRRKRRPNRAAIINQQAQNLPALLEMKSQREHQNKVFGLQEKEFESTKAHQTEMLDIEKENQELAERLGYANLGLNTFFEFAKYGDGGDSGIWESAGSGIKKFGSEVADTFSDIYDWAGDLFDF